MSVYLKLLNIQEKLKAPKSQFNSFGKYNYRNCEDILEGVKPILKENNCILLIKDDVQIIGERYYIKAKVSLIDIEDGKEISSEAFAREEENKKGMDGSQVTGAASSYARKYALNGLFAIDDTKDSDSTNQGDDKKKTELSDAQVKRAYAIAKGANITNEQVKQWIMTKYKKTSLADLTKKEYDELIISLEAKKAV